MSAPHGVHLDPRRMPKHVAIIMDGNGRWAQRRGLPRFEGHREGMNSVRAVIRACSELKIPFLTLYAFSTENWKRPAREVSFLMNLLIKFLSRELDELHGRQVKVVMLGQRENIPDKVLACIDGAVARTRHNPGLQVNLAFNYGGRREILEAVAAYVKARPRPVLTEAVFADYLYTAGVPDPDVLVRTSGELRLSNFLLWQLAYAEIVPCPALWPDFREPELYQALAEYQKRERRFGGVESVHV